MLGKQIRKKKKKKARFYRLYSHPLTFQFHLIKGLNQRLLPLYPGDERKSHIKKSHMVSSVAVSTVLK